MPLSALGSTQRHKAAQLLLSGTSAVLASSSVMNGTPISVIWPCDGTDREMIALLADISFSLFSAVSST